MNYLANSRAGLILGEILEKSGNKKARRRVNSLITNYYIGLNELDYMESDSMYKVFVTLWRNENIRRAEQLSNLPDRAIDHLRNVIKTIAKQRIRGYIYKGSIYEKSINDSSSWQR